MKPTPFLLKTVCSSPSFPQMHFPKEILPTFLELYYQRRQLPSSHQPRLLGRARPEAAITAVSTLWLVDQSLCFRISHHRPFAETVVGNCNIVQTHGLPGPTELWLSAEHVGPSSKSHPSQLPLVPHRPPAPSPNYFIYHSFTISALPNRSPWRQEHELTKQCWLSCL